MVDIWKSKITHRACLEAEQIIVEGKVKIFIGNEIKSIIIQIIN